MPVITAAQVGTIALALLCSAATASAQDPVAQFYKGKTINFYIGYTAGGTYDLYARLVARYMGDHIPGKPVILARNMPGSGGHIAAGYVDSVVQADGTSLATADFGVRSRTDHRGQSAALRREQAAIYRQSDRHQ